MKREDFIKLIEADDRPHAPGDRPNPTGKPEVPELQNYDQWLSTLPKRNSEWEQVSDEINDLPDNRTIDIHRQLEQLDTRTGIITVLEDEHGYDILPDGTVLAKPQTLSVPRDWDFGQIYAWVELRELIEPGDHRGYLKDCEVREGHILTDYIQESYHEFTRSRLTWEPRV